MQFADREAYAVLWRQPSGSHRFAIYPSSTQALRTWCSSTRISPVFPLDDADRSPSEYIFPGHSTVLFLGPVDPLIVIETLPPSCKVWLSLGLFNVIACVFSEDDARQAFRWADEYHVPFERWELNSGEVQFHSTSAPVERDEQWRDRIAGLSEATCAPELREAIQEYCPLMASTLARSAILSPSFFDDLCSIHEYVATVAESSTSGDPSTPYRFLGQLLNVNAGLSRLSSQTFAGTPPITETECHLWSHSLLGIGLASLALCNLRRFLQSTLGDQRLRERFLSLRSFTSGVPDLSHELPADADVLAAVDLGSASHSHLIPLLAYFSARDGYHSTETTISAPLAAVSGCNSRRWSLLTMTHEISHVVVRAVEAELIPDLTDEVALEECYALLQSAAPSHSLFEELHRLFLTAILDIDRVAAAIPAGEPFRLTKYTLRNILQHWRHDVDEIMTHVFDFLYFYGRDPERYIQGIWASWGTIPNISSRVRDYVVRSICAILSIHLRRGAIAELTARDTVRECLTKLDATLGGRYVEEALHYIDEQWDSDILPKVRARRQLVKLVTHYLFSEQAATIVRREPAIAAGGAEREGYLLKPRRIEGRTISNPIRFVDAYTDATPPSAIDSTWILYVLAFYVMNA